MKLEEIWNLPFGKVIDYVEATTQRAIDDNAVQGGTEFACSIVKGANQLNTLEDIQSALMELTKEDVDILCKMGDELCKKK